MAAKPVWLLQLPRIREQVEALRMPVLDRACVERLFGVRRRRAIELMHVWGGYQAGRTFLIDRHSLLRTLEQLEAGGAYEWERVRRERLDGEIERLHKALPGRQVRINVSSEARDRVVADLPAGIQLRAGELRIAFRDAGELLRLLVELGQAMTNDYRRFEELCRATAE